MQYVSHSYLVEGVEIRQRVAHYSDYSVYVLTRKDTGHRIALVNVPDDETNDGLDCWYVWSNYGKKGLRELDYIGSEANADEILACWEDDISRELSHQEQSEQV